MPEEELYAKPKSARKPFGWQFWLFLAVVIVILAVFINPAPRQNIRANQVEALNNLRQIGLSLHEFEGKFGEFPSDDTVALVIIRHSGSSHGLNGSSSNALFRQLFAAEVADNELIGYAKVPGVRRPDGDISPGKLLEKGEVAFAYIAGLSSAGSPNTHTWRRPTPRNISGLSSAGNPNRPMAFAPVIPGTTRFDPKPFKGYAVILRIDYSVTSMKIRKDGQVHLDGIDILSPEHPIWDGKAPDIRYPDL